MDERVNLPEVLWAQRPTELYVTINLADCKIETLDLTENKIKFRGKSHDKLYGFELEFCKAIDVENSQYSSTKKDEQSSRNIFMVLAKKDKEDTEYWPRLYAGKGRLNFVKTDFSRWKDEDESEDEAPNPMGGLGGGFPGMEGMDFSKFGGGEGAGGFDPSQFSMGDMGDMAGMADQEESSSSHSDSEEEKEQEKEQEEQQGKQQEKEEVQNVQE